MPLCNGRPELLTTKLFIKSESVKFKVRISQKSYAAIDCGFSLFHPMGKSLKWSKSLRCKGQHDFLRASFTDSGNKLYFANAEGQDTMSIIAETGTYLFKALVSLNYNFVGLEISLRSL